MDPRGSGVVAVAQQAGQIQFWDVDQGALRGSIDGVRDICSGRDAKHGRGVAATHTRGKHGNKDKYKFGIEGVNLNQHFSSISFSASGNLLLACSRNSPYLCLYGCGASGNAAPSGAPRGQKKLQDTSLSYNFSLLYRYSLTQNASLSGLSVKLNSGKTLVDGDAWADFDNSDDEREEAHERRAKRMRAANELPGVKTGDAAAAYERGQFHASGTCFSADAKQLGVATSHGLFLFKLDLGGTSTEDSVHGTALERFSPALLTKNVSVPAIERALVQDGDLAKAMILALALNDASVLLAVYEHIPKHSVCAVVNSVSPVLLPSLLHFLACVLHPTLGSKTLELNMHWLEALLDIHAATLLQWLSGNHTASTRNVFRLQDMLESVSGNKTKSKTGKSNTQADEASARSDVETATAVQVDEEEDDALLLQRVSVGDVQALLLQCLQTTAQQQKNMSHVFERNRHSLAFLAEAGRSVPKKDVADNKSRGKAKGKKEKVDGEGLL